jgi:mRNA deadenylase 3'-5' endonuclease subunit Ccr4/uncharacterized protein with PIN domain
MAKMRPKKERKRRVRKPPKEGRAGIRPSWVDRLQFSAAAAEDNQQAVPEEDASWISLVCWNVLAHSYCSRGSQRNLPLEYQKVVFHPTKRKQRILDVLHQLTEEADILCLQEVDMDQLGSCLKKIGWDGVETPRLRNGGGSGSKVDSCLVYVNTAHWKVLEHKVVFFDNLATLSSVDSGKIPSVLTSNLQGLQQSFLRRNVGILVRLEDVHAGRTLVVANTHLYWNPNFEYVKFCQSHYFLQQAREFLVSPDEPMVFCGDLNSKPTGCVYRYLSQGNLDARRVAPWNNLPLDTDSTDSTEESTKLFGLTDQMKGLQLEQGATKAPQMRYLLDFTLNKLCRWLRILGQDTALESEEEERLRTKDKKMVIFDRCRQEGRTLVTTSTRLLQRNDCPAGTYLVNPKSLPNLEVTLVHLLRTHGAVLDPVTFLTRCVVCNGKIAEVHVAEEKKRILTTYDAPTDSDLEVYECDGCQQGYWWSDRPNSSASRVKGTATRLLELCLRAGVGVRDVKDLGVFGDVDIQEHISKGWDYTLKGSEILQQELDVLQWLHAPVMECPFRLESAYAHWTKDGGQVGESLPFTNVTDTFVDTLDYIWFEGSKLTVDERLWIPKSFAALNELDLSNGHLLPSDVFPSDHLPVGARLSLEGHTREEGEKAQTETEVKEDGEAVKAEPTKETSPDVMAMMTFAQPAAHSRRCDCGCVPAIPSLFEMAEMRRKAREEKKKAG